MLQFTIYNVTIVHAITTDTSTMGTQLQSVFRCRKNTDVVQDFYRILSHHLLFTSFAESYFLKSVIRCRKNTDVVQDFYSILSHHLLFTSFAESYTSSQLFIIMARTIFFIMRGRRMNHTHDQQSKGTFHDK